MTAYDLGTIEYRSLKEHLEKLEAREVTPEAVHDLFTVEWDGKRFDLPANILSIVKIKARVAAYNAKQRVRNEILNRLLTELILALDKNDEKWLRRLAKGDTFLGKVIFGFLDITPLPNFHEILKAVEKEYPDATAAEKAKLIFEKIDWTRTATGLAIAIGLALGWLKPEWVNAIM